jgi:hypothetical protein
VVTVADALDPTRTFSEILIEHGPVPEDDVVSTARGRRGGGSGRRVRRVARRNRFPGRPADRRAMGVAAEPIRRADLVKLLASFPSGAAACGGMDADRLRAALGL